MARLRVYHGARREVERQTLHTVAQAARGQGRVSRSISIASTRVTSPSHLSSASATGSGKPACCSSSMDGNSASYARSYGKPQRDEARARLLEYGFSALDEPAEDIS